MGFPDGSTRPITHIFKGRLALRNTDNEEKKQIEVHLLVLKTSLENRIILGRELLQKLKLNITGSDKVTLDDQILFETEKPEEADITEHLAYMTEQEILFEEDDVPDSTPNTQDLEITLKSEPEAPWGRPTIRIPWRGKERPPLSYAVARARDKKNVQKLTVEEQSLYNTAIEQLIHGGFAIQLPIGSPIEGHFIAVRPVFKQDRESTKCRLCLDARQLNAFTNKGPQEGMSNIHCMMLFRTSKYMSTFDLDKAFWQVKLDPEEQKYFSTVINGKRYRFTRLVFGGNFSPAGLQQSLQMILHKTQPAPESEYTYYVDDFAVRNESRDELISNQQRLRTNLSNHGFPSSKLRITGDEENEFRKYLGYQWNSHTDQIQSRKKIIELVDPNNPLQRKELTGKIMELYDPVGLQLKLHLAGRQIIREAYTEKDESGCKPWKVPVSTEIKQKLNVWIEMVNSENNQMTTAPRQLTCSTLYIFSDASLQAWVFQIHDAELRLLYARGGLLSNECTVPRGELIALHMAVTAIKEQLPLDLLGTREIVILTDSEPTVHRLRNPSLDNNMPQFERKRVAEIRSIMKEFSTKLSKLVIHSFPGRLNLADDATRPNIRNNEPISKEEIMLHILKPRGYRYSSSEKPEIEVESESLWYMTLRSNRKDTPQRSPIRSENAVQPTADTTDPIITPLRLERDNLLARLRANQSKNPDIRKTTAHTQVDEEGIITDSKHKIILYNDGSELLTELVRNAHSSHHYGIAATFGTLKQTYNWKGMRANVKQFVLNCPTCSLVRLPHNIRSAVGDNPQWINSLDDLGPGSIVGVDVCEMIEEFGYCGFLTTTCAITKWIRVTPIGTQLSHDLCAALEQQFYATLFPRVLVTDGAMSFRSRVFETWCLKHRIVHLVSPAAASPYHGWYERPHKQILEQLRLLIVDQPTKGWSEFLPMAQYLVNSRAYDFNDDTGLCPLHLIHVGSTATYTDIDKLPDESLLQKLRDIGIDHLLPELPEKYKRIGAKLHSRQRSLLQKYEALFKAKRNEAKKRMKEASQNQKIYDFEPGTYVRVYRPKSSKVAPSYSQPRKILSAPSQGTRFVETSEGKKTLEYIANLVPYFPPAEPPPPSCPPECSEPEL